MKKTIILSIAFTLVYILSSVQTSAQNIIVENCSAAPVSFSIICSIATGGPWVLAAGGTLTWSCPPGETIAAFNVCGLNVALPGKVGFTPVTCPGGVPSALYYDYVLFVGWVYKFY